MKNDTRNRGMHRGMLRIDGAKLDGLIRQKGLKKSDISKAAGMNSNYIQECIYENKIRIANAKLMALQYGILLEDYIYIEPDTHEENASNGNSLNEKQTDATVLREAIIEAIRYALKDKEVLNGLSKLITGILGNK